jgi:site-specific DNA-adenine methylase
LLIELERKNFIPENESKKASAYFTKSNSIDKLLDYKGEFNLSKERYSYPKIFGTNAVNKFEKILPNPKPTKD